MGRIATLFTFRGRLNRAAFWRIKIFVALLNLVGHLLVLPMLARPPHGLALHQQVQAMGAGPILILLVLAIVVCWIAFSAGVRRWHDRDKSGWWILILFIPVVGFVWYAIECGFLPGTTGANRYGPDPLG